MEILKTILLVALTLSGLVAVALLLLASPLARIKSPEEMNAEMNLDLLRDLRRREWLRSPPGIRWTKIQKVLSSVLVWTTFTIVAAMLLGAALSMFR